MFLYLCKNQVKLIDGKYVYYIQNIYISFDSILTTSTQPGYRIVYICIAVGDPDIKKGNVLVH
jgi:hypothetical protein